MRAIGPGLSDQRHLKGLHCFQLFGVDILLNQQMHPFILEFNKGPSMKAVNQIDQMMKFQLLEDVFDLYGLLQLKRENGFQLIWEKQY